MNVVPAYPVRKGFPLGCLNCYKVQATGSASNRPTRNLHDSPKSQLFVDLLL